MFSIIYHSDPCSGEYFFSTDHCQPTDTKFVPVTVSNRTYDQVRELKNKMGSKEIKNPDPKFQPDEYLMEIVS